MAYVPQLEVALALGLQLSLKDRLKLVEWLVSSVEHELESKTSGDYTQSDTAIYGLLDGLDLTEWQTLGIDDPVKWVKQLRRKQGD